MNATGERVLVRSIEVRGLFGDRDISISVPEIDGLPSQVALLFGSNGSGKTTLLNMVWNALSAADNRGHRTQLARTPFREFKIVFDTGAVLEFAKVEGLLGSFDVTLTVPGERAYRAHYAADPDLKVRSGGHDSAKWARYYLEELARHGLSERDERSRRKILEELRLGERRYIAFLEQEVGTPLFLGDDRSLRSDELESESSLGEYAAWEAARRSDRLGHPVLHELEATVHRVNEYLRRLALGAQTSGSRSSNAIYLDLLRALSQTQPAEESPNVESLASRVAALSARAARMEAYGLTPRLEADEMATLVLRSGAMNGPLVDKVFSPYVASLESRYGELEQAFTIIDTLVTSVNRYLRGKSIAFTVNAGLVVNASNGEALELPSLSSGERQLLTLMLNTVVAAASTRLFLIDEPELSLGVDWQRDIVATLLRLTGPSEVQFIVATHSIEVLASARGSVVSLG